MDHGQETKNEQINLWLAEVSDVLYDSGSATKVEIYRSTLLALARLVRRQRLDVLNAEEALVCAREDWACIRSRLLETNRKLRDVLKGYACDCAEPCEGAVEGSYQESLCGFKAREAVEGEI
jgi:hypothetical protein